MANFSFDGAGSGELGAESVAGLNDNGDAFGGVNLGSNGSGSIDGSGDVDAFGTVFDPATHAGRDRFNANGSFSKKRGRAAGGSGGSARPSARSNNPKKADHSASVNALSQTLMIVHAGIASMTKITELEIDNAESDALATSLANVLEHFDIAPDPKVQAIIGLVTTAGMIYGPRFYLYNERLKQSKKKPASVHLINPGGAPINIEEPVA